MKKSTSLTRLSEYRVMWILVFFDLPTETAEEKKAYLDFRKRLLNDGFTMFQFSVYMRHCLSVENANVHIERIRKCIPSLGMVGMLCITDRQFANMQVFYGSKQKPPKSPGQQLELF